jgi:hypothetical protein
MPENSKEIIKKFPKNYVKNLLFNSPIMLSEAYPPKTT